MNFREVTHCRICGSGKLFPYLDLGSVPLANSLTTHSESYPVKVLFCYHCYLSQLSVVIDPAVLYHDYSYHSSVSETFQKHCYELALTCKKIVLPHFPPGKENLLSIDIASNDGCLMEQFEKAGYYTIGVEPAKNLADEATAKGLSIVNEFFSESVSKRLPCADVVTALNVLAHVDDLIGFLKYCRRCIRLTTGGILIVEVPYLCDLIQKNQFDTIYHEHLSYFLFKPLHHLFKINAIPIFRVEHLDIHGGSLRLYASPSPHEISDSVYALLKFEENKNLYQFSTYRNFSEKISRLKNTLSDVLKSIHKEGKKVMGFGASAKGISLLNYSRIKTDLIHSIVDETPDKQGKLTPGSNIPIVDFSHFAREKPDYILLLAWNFEKELREKTKHLGAKYILPIPQVTIED